MCITKKQKDGYSRAILKNAQQALSEVMGGKKEAVAGKKQKQALMGKNLTPCSMKSVESSMMDSQKSGSMMQR